MKPYLTAVCMGVLFIAVLSLASLPIKAGEIVPGANTMLLFHFNDDVQGAGQTITDSSGQGNDGITSGDVDCTVPGKLGLGCGFDGERIDVGDHQSLNITGNLTVSTWVKSDFSLVYHTIIQKGEAGAYTYRLYTYGTEVGWGHTDGGGTDVIYTTPVLPKNSWVHLVATRAWNGTGYDMKIYVNGTLARSGQLLGSADLSEVGLFIGNSVYMNSDFNGIIDEVAIWNRTLAANEVLALYQAGVGACIDSDGDGYGAVGTNLTDCSGSQTVEDCNDSNRNIYPNAPEICDGVDNQCYPGETGYGQIDENLVPPPCVLQQGVCSGSLQTCGGSSGWLACGSSEYGNDYEAVEVSCSDGLDNDCDGLADGNDPDCGTVPPSGCDYTVNSGESINKFNNDVTPGQTVCIMAGTYAETLNPTKSGSSGSPITYKAYPGDGCQGVYAEPKTLGSCQVVIDGERTRNIAIELESNLNNYIRIEGLEIKNFLSGAVNIRSWGSSNYAQGIEIANNFVHDNGGDILRGDGEQIIKAKSTQNSIFENNEIWRNSGTAISLGGGSDPRINTINITIRGNNIHYNGKDGIDGGGRDVLIEYNKIYNQFHTETHQDGIDTDEDLNWVIRYNTIYDLTQLIYFDTDSGGYHENIEIYGNVLFTDQYWHRIGSLGYHSNAPGIYITEGNDISIHSNTCGWMGSNVLPGTGETEDGYKCVQLQGGITNAVVRNNIAYFSRFDVSVNDPNEVDSDYNLFYGTFSSPGWSGEGPNTKINTDPQFTNYSLHGPFDFRLKPTSPAIDNGTDLSSLFSLPSPFVDIDGTARPQGGPGEYDMGAYEHVPPASGCDYTINPGESINKYSTTAQPGETVCVRAGTYNEALVPQNSGIAGNLITFKAYPGEGCQGEYAGPKSNCQVAIDGEGASTSGVGFSYGGGVQYIRIEGFEIRNWQAGGGGTAVYYSTNSNNIEIVNCNIHSNSEQAIWVFGRNNLVENNYIHNGGGNGLVAGTIGASAIPAINLTVKGNRFHDNWDDAVKVVLEQSVIENNVLGPGGYTTPAHSDGMSTSHMVNSIIRNNIIYDYTQEIYVSLWESAGNFENVAIYGNVFYDNEYFKSMEGTAPGINLMPGTPDSGPHYINNISIHSNTFLWTGLAGIKILEKCNEVSGACIPVTNISIKNNIFYDSYIEIGYINTREEGGPFRDPSQIDSDYNLFYDSPDPGPAFPWTYEGSHSIFEQDPQFVNYILFESWDARLKSGSPAIDNGTNLGFTFNDIDGTSRPQGLRYDIGAYEYVSGAPTCLTTADTDCDGTVSFAELNAHIQAWYACSACVTDLFEAMEAWYGI